MLTVWFFLKRLADLIGAVILLLLLSPLFIILALAIRMDTPGPVFFLQDRLGKNGKVFKICKFRSMVVGAERMGSGLFNYADDPRVTRMGHFLRNTSLDEIPQLWNILKGDMSFVGPRPPVVYELGDYQDFENDLKRGFSMKPGVTGLAQIKGRNELSRDEKTFWNRKYVDLFSRWSLLLDGYILVLTAWIVLLNKGSHELEENHEADQSKIKEMES